MPFKIEVKNLRTGSIEAVELNNEDVFGLNVETVSEEQLQLLNMMFFIKDKCNVSSRAYQELAKVYKFMPRYYKIQERIAELITLWQIKPTPNGTCGVQQSLEGRLRRVEHLHTISNPGAFFRKERCLHVKLSGNGTNIGKRLHVVNFTLLF